MGDLVRLKLDPEGVPPDSCAKELAWLLLREGSSMLDRRGDPVALLVLPRCSDVLL